MIYYLYPVLLLIYFELLGRSFATYFSRLKLYFYFPLGFILWTAVSYVTGWPITAFNLSFQMLSAYYLLLLLGSLGWVGYRWRKISWSFSWQAWVILLAGVSVLCYFSATRTLGETHGFDTLYYINFIHYNMDVPALNSIHPHFGTWPNTYKDTITYVFQSFYYMIPVAISTLQKLCHLLHIRFDTLPAYVTSTQIFCHLMWVAICLDVLREFSLAKIQKFFLFVLFLFFMGNFYYNQVYGFIGNNFRMGLHAWGSIFLFRYFKNNEKSDKYLFYLSLLSLCSVASTGTFSAVFILFGLFFVWAEKEEKLWCEYAVVLSVPTLNILISRLGAKPLLVVLVFGAMILIFAGNNWLHRFWKQPKLRMILLIFCSVAMASGSLYLTHNLFDFHAFFNNYSEIADMSWDYFMFQDVRHYLFNAFVLLPFFYYLLKGRKESFAQVAWVHILVIYNPFCCTIMNKVNWVYYRSYDLLLNPFTFVYYFAYCQQAYPKLQKALAVALGVLAISLSSLQIPHYFHESFRPGKDYDTLYKIESSELEIIRNVQKMVKEENIKNPRIITPTFFMPSFIPHSSYLYGKEKRYDYDHFTEDSYQLYLIFFPHDDSYDNFYPQKEQPDYLHVKDYLRKHLYDILVLDNGLYYTNEAGNHRPLTALVEEAGYKKSRYSSARYSVYDIR